MAKARAWYRSCVQHLFCLLQVGLEVTHPEATTPFLLRYMKMSEYSSSILLREFNNYCQSNRSLPLTDGEVHSMAFLLLTLCFEKLDGSVG